MAIGDAADAAGMDTLAGTEDLRDTYIEHNRTRDYLANHQTSGTHDASAINAGTLDDARLPPIPVAKIPAGIPASKVNGGVWNGSVNSPTTVVAAGNIASGSTYAHSVAGDGGVRAVYVGFSSGAYGGVTSSRRFKEDIEAADLPRHVLRGLRVVFYRYIANTEHDEPLELGLIAEEVHDLGLHWLVEYDDGLPFALKERAFPFLALLLAQDAEDRIDALLRDVDDLRADFLALRDAS